MKRNNKTEEDDDDDGNDDESVFFRHADSFLFYNHTIKLNPYSWRSCTFSMHSYRLRSQFLSQFSMLTVDVWSRLH